MSVRMYLWNYHLLTPFDFIDKTNPNKRSYQEYIFFNKQTKNPNKYIQHVLEEKHTQDIWQMKDPKKMSVRMYLWNYHLSTPFDFIDKTNPNKTSYQKYYLIRYTVHLQNFLPSPWYSNTCTKHPLSHQCWAL